MAKYRLKAGVFVTGNGAEAREYHWSDRTRNIVESDQNLAAQHPEKFELVQEWAEGPYDYNPHSSKVSPPREAQQRAQAPATSPTHAHAPNLKEQAPADKEDARPSKAEEKASQTHKGMPPLTPTTAKRVNATGKTLEDQYGPLDEMTVSDLKEIASQEEIDLKGATHKADILKALKAAK